MLKWLWSLIFPQQAIRTLHTRPPQSELNENYYNLPDVDTEPLDDRYTMRDGETLEQWLERMESYQ